MLAKFSLITTLLLTPTIVSAEILSVHCPLGCPSSPQKNDVIFAHLYALSNNPDTKFADWVAYEVSPVNFGVSPGRDWASDPLLDESETLEEKDYKGANKALKVDRGHQAPLASFAGNQYWYELNYLSNITPQASTLNQGVWVDLEIKVREASEFRDSLFVITGPIYDGDSKTMPGADEEHQIPNGYFKVIYDRRGNTTSFIMNQNEANSISYCSKATSIAAVQSHINFSLPARLINTPEMKKRLNC